MKMNKGLLIMSLCLAPLVIGCGGNDRPSTDNNAPSTPNEGDNTPSLTPEKGDKGDTGETGPVGPQGPSGQDGAAGKSAYEDFVEKYGYVGSETEWFTDLENSHLGFEKTYDIKIITMTFDSSYRGGSGSPFIFKVNTETKTYKNGEKITFDLTKNILDNYRFIGATDENIMDDMHMGPSIHPLKKSRSLYHEPGLIDVNDYRAYKDCNIYLAYDEFEFVADYDQNQGMKIGETETIVPIRTGLSAVNGPSYLELEPEELAKIKIYNLNEDPDVEVSFDATTSSIKINQTTGYFDLLLVYGKQDAYVGFEIKESTKPTKRAYDNVYIHTDLKDELMNLKVRQEFTLNFYTLNEYAQEVEVTGNFYEHNTGYEVRINNSKFLISQAGGSSYLALEEGTDTIQVINKRTMEVIFETPIKVSAKDATITPKDRSLEANLTTSESPRTYEVINTNIKVDLTKAGQPISLNDVDVNVIDLATRKATTNFAIDAANESIKFTKVGNYSIEFKLKAEEVYSKEFVLKITNEKIVMPNIITSFYSDVTYEYELYGYKSTPTGEKDVNSGVILNQDDIYPFIVPEEFDFIAYHFNPQFYSEDKIANFIVNGKPLLDNKDYFNYTVDLSTDDNFEIEVTSEDFALGDRILLPSEDFKGQVYSGLFDESKGEILNKKLVNMNELFTLPEGDNLYLLPDSDPHYNLEMSYVNFYGGSVNCNTFVTETDGTRYLELLVSHDGFLEIDPLYAYVLPSDVSVTSIELDPEFKNGTTFVETDPQENHRKVHKIQGTVYLSNGETASLHEMLSSSVLDIKTTTETTALVYWNVGFDILGTGKGTFEITYNDKSTRPSDVLLTIDYNLILDIKEVE